MRAEFISDPDGTEEDWRLTSSRGCCTFLHRFEDAKPVIEISTGCHDCINEINSYALERAIPIRVKNPAP
jgi:hypothetical protein